MLQYSAGSFAAVHGLVAAASSTKSSSSSLPLLILIVLFVALYFLWIRPQRNKVRQQQLAQVRNISVGDEVVTQAGIVGTVQWLDDDRIGVEIAPGTTIVVVRAAIGRRVLPPMIDVDETPEPPPHTPSVDSLESATDADPDQDPGDGRKWWPGAGGGRS
jgi:preprotein translocase subunit YajC